MANLCEISMHVVGKEADVKKFISMLTANYVMDPACEYETRSDGMCIGILNGDVRWSIKSALNHNGELEDECRKYGVNIEAYSSELGFGFQEHIRCINGKLTEDCVDYEEVCYEPEEWDSFEEFKKENDIPEEIIVNDLEDGMYYRVGGYEEWNFDTVDSSTVERENAERE